MLLSHRAPGNPALHVFPIVPLPSELAGRIEASAARDPVFRTAIADEWPKLLRIMDDLVELYDEIPITDFVPLWQSVMRLSAFGIIFDAGFLDWLDRLHATIGGTDEDTDADASDQLLEMEDDDIDHSDFWLDCDAAGDDKGTNFSIDSLAAMGSPEAMEFVAIRDGYGQTTSDGILDALLRDGFIKEFGRPPESVPGPLRIVAIPATPNTPIGE